MTAIRLSPELPELTTELFTSATAIVGLRGSGKTNDGVVIVEEAVRCHVPCCVVDPTGVWWGLKSSPDGKSPGLPVYVFGGVHGDVPLEPTAGALLARFIVEKPVPMVLDLSDFSKGQQRRFVTDFMVTLYDLKNRQRDPLLVVLDEAGRFVPQTMMRGDLELAKCIGAVEDTVTLGRSRGLGSLLIGQRSATINKNVLTQVDNLIAMRLTGPHDRKALDEWISEKAEGQQAERNELVQNLPSLKTGEGFFWSPSLFGVFRRVKFGARKTFDSSRTPKIGEKLVAPKVYAEVDLGALTAEIAATKERAKADDPKALRARIAELERDLSKRPQVLDDHQVCTEQLRAMERRAVAAETDWQQVQGENAQLVAQQIELQKLADQIVDIAQRIVPYPPPQRLGRRAEAPRPAPVQTIVDRGGNTASHVAPTIGLSDKGEIGKGERVVLVAVAQHPAGCTREQISLLTGYKRSTRDLYVQRLGRAGFVDVTGGTIHATAAGVESLGSDFERLPTGRKLREYWIERLPAGESSVFALVLENHPKGVGRTEISELTGYKRSTRDLYIQRLQRRQLVRMDGSLIRASDALF